MADIKKIRPATPKLSKCQASRVTPYWTDVIGKSYTRTRPASYSINGKVYCRLHAGGIALDLLTESTE